MSWGSDGSAPSWDSPRAPASIRRGGTALHILLLVGLTALAYWNAVQNPFVYDDVMLILRNSEIQSLSNLPAIVGFTEEGFEFRNRWTRSFSYALEFAAAGPYSPLFHLDNVLLHCLVGLLVYALIRRASRSPGLAWWTAALFLVHPLGTEVASHVSGRRELLATLFSLLMMSLLLPYLRTGGWWRAIAAALSLYLAAYSKEFAVMAPIAFGVVVLYARNPPGRPGDTPSSAGLTPLFEDVRDLLLDRRLFWFGLACLTLALALSLLLLTSVTVESTLGGRRSYYEMSQTPLSFRDWARLVGMGLRLLIAPVGQSVTYDYDALGLAGSSRGLLYYLDLAVFAFCLGLTLHGLVRRSWIGLGGAWFFLFYLPHTGIVAWHEIFAERWLYAAGIGFHLAVASALLSAWRATRWRPLVGAAGIAVLATLVVGTHLRNEAWSSPEALWSQAVERYPGSARAHKGIGNVHLQNGRRELALEHFRIAAEIMPTYRDVRLGIAVSLKDLRRTDEALAYIDGILADWPEDPHALYLKGQIFDMAGRQAEAVALHERAIASDPGFARAYNELGRLYAMAGDVPRAIEMLETCLRHDPTVLAALQNLATLHMALGHEELAAEYERRTREFARSRSQTD